MKKEKNKIDKKSANFIDSSRISQLSSYISYAKENDVTYEKKFSALKVIQDSLIDMNKDKSKFLRRFLTTYIPSLNKYELDEIYSKIFKYIDFLRNTTYYYGNKSRFEMEVFDVLEYPDQFSLKEVLYYLLMNFVFLPYADNQQDFNNQMVGILKRLDNFISKLYPENLYIIPINTSQVWDALDVEYFEIPLAIKETISSHPFLRKVGLLVDLPSQDRYAYEIIDSDKVEMSLVLELGKKFDKTGKRLTYFTLADLFSRIKDFRQVGDAYIWTINVKNENYLTIFLKLEEPKIDKDSLGIERQYVQIRIYAEPNQKILNNDTYRFVDYALNTLPDHVERLVGTLNGYFLDKSQREKLDKMIVNFNYAIENYKPAKNDNKGIVSNEFTTNSSILHKIDTDKLDVEDELIFPPNIEQQLSYLVDYLKNRDIYLKYNPEPIKGAVFFGPPGVGKTAFVKYLAKSTGSDFFQLNTDDIRDEYVGGSEKKIRKAFNEFYESLKSKKAILYIDEIDGLMGVKGDRDHMEGVRSIFLQELDGFSTDNDLWKKGFIIVSTNYPQAIDKALKERLGFKIKFEMPTKKEVIRFFDYRFKKLSGEGIKLDITPVDTAEIVGIKSYRILSKALNHALNMSMYYGNIPPVINEEFIKKGLQIAIEQEEDEKKMGFSI